MSRPKGYVDSGYLRTVGEFVKALKLLSYDHMHIQAGQSVLDVGCGPASDTIELAAMVGPTGTVFGIDYDQSMIEGAERRAREAGLADVVKHQRADSAHLPFRSAQFDSCRSERLFKQQGLVEIEIHPFPLVTTDLAFMRQATVIDETERIARAEGVITEEKLNHWRAELKDADDRGLFFAVMLQLLAVGRKPS